QEHGAIFIHIQKTGGNSVTAALGKSFAEPDKHWTALQLRRATDPSIWTGYYKFAFVRNPWARLVSWYAMIDRHRPAFEQGVTFNRFQTAVLTRTKNFADFLHNMDEVFDDADGSKWIFRNQLDYLTDVDGTLLVDFVGRTETLGADFAAIATHLKRQPGPIDMLNTSEHRPYQDYYTPDLAQLVGERYASDIAHFGYHFGD
ncbi:MAG: sulfotransferase family 2 domain-containing protein, partial [Terricaulis sp.]